MQSYHIIVLLFIGYIIFAIDKKKEAFPVPVILLLVGVGLSFIPFFSPVEVTKEMIFNWFLPALLFVSAYHFPFQQLKKNVGMIVTLSTIGLLVTALLLAVCIYFICAPFLPLSFVEALLIASILTPSDPVSVISVLKQSTKDSKMAYVVEGESMLNDGTSIVLFTVLAGMYLNDRSFTFSSFVIEFVIVSLAGVFIGAIFGRIVTKAVPRYRQESGR